ncbi:HAD-like domain-containing protein [Zychaea mexicana]|uniref:HAD-like domain-containing protein n=1 Tax=Zychaea mexicana TaxID=64656 RepID=UPI0022FEE84D|nr:HAD-like domain-containing protein [Zychaea mexicana]KAI9496814.1 HAD-like domain-containing protein [Zychaea mexicana]
MFRTTATRFIQRAARRSYSSQEPTEKASSAAHKLAQEALAQKTGGGNRKATLPKGDKKPAKAASEKDGHWKAYALGAGAVVGTGLGLLFYYGRPFNDGREDKYVNNDPFSAAYNRCFDRYNEFQKKMHEPMWEKLLPDPLPEPYQRPYTLVINLDDTLVHSTWDSKHGWRHAKRPGVDYFLAYLSQFYEIVIFTSQTSMNAQPILDSLDPYQYAMYRLYREATRYVDGKYVKDLSHLNRDLSKVIIMDSNPDSFAMQPENGVPLRPFTGKPNDQGLLEYIPFLEGVALFNVPDVRPVLKAMEGGHLPEKWAEWEKKYNDQHRLQWEQEKTSKPRNLGSLLTGGGAAGQEQEQGPPPTQLEQLRKQMREGFSAEHGQMRQQQDEMMKKEMEAQKEKMKDMKMTVWDLMTQVSSGQPIVPPGGEGQQQQQPSQQ